MKHSRLGVHPTQRDELLRLSEQLSREHSDRRRSWDQMSKRARRCRRNGPSPTSSSWTLEMLTRILAAGLSSAMDLRIVAPSLVTVISPVEVECRILFMPLGPSVDLTRSPSASAPTKDERRACSPSVRVHLSRPRRAPQPPRSTLPLMPLLHC